MGAAACGHHRGDQQVCSHHSTPAGVTGVGSTCFQRSIPASAPAESCLYLHDIWFFLKISFTATLWRILYDLKGLKSLCSMLRAAEITITSMKWPPDNVSLSYFWGGSTADAAVCGLKCWCIFSSSLVSNVGKLHGSFNRPSATSQMQHLHFPPTQTLPAVNKQLWELTWWWPHTVDPTDRNTRRILATKFMFPHQQC